MKIGIVDLDTSHPVKWIPILREMGHEVTGVWDAGDVHPPEYVRDFVAKLSIPVVFPSLAAMAAKVDCAIIHSSNWDAHVERARPFVEAGRAILVDKPIAGNLKDLLEFKSWADRGMRITGGSCLRFADETLRFLEQPVLERGTPHTVICGCGVDDFNYGIHAYSHLCGILGSGIVSVRHLGTSVQRHVQLNWSDGRIGMVVIGKQVASLPFYSTIITEKGVHQLSVNNARIYHALLEATLPFLSGKAALAPVPWDVLVEPELAALAAQVSWNEGNREVRIAELSTMPSCSYDGAGFASDYRKAKYRLIPSQTDTKIPGSSPLCSAQVPSAPDSIPLASS